MPRPMTKYKVNVPKAEIHSFKPVRRGLAYHYKGKLKTYANIKQADVAVNALKMAGFEVERTIDWPFLIIHT